MKILLTGACGLVGRATLSANAGVHQIVPFDQSEKVEAMGGVRASITDRDAVMRAAQGCHAIIHTAAMHGAFRHTAQPRQFIETNVIGTEYIFEAALAHGIRRLVISSTLEVLCGGDWCASGITVYDQTTPPRPDGFYPPPGRHHAGPDRPRAVGGARHAFHPGGRDGGAARPVRGARKTLARQPGGARSAPVDAPSQPLLARVPNGAGQAAIGLEAQGHVRALADAIGLAAA